MKSNEEITVLVVDDEGSLRKSIVRNLEIEDFNVLSAANGREAIEIVKAQKIDFVLSDVRMPDMDGVELLDEIRKYSPTVPIVVLMTGFAEVSKEEVLEKGALDLIAKPFDIDAIVEVIKESVNSIGS
jgi:CheY-like chemotaxis protein